MQPSRPLSPPLLLPSAFPSIGVFSSELALRIRWPKYRSFSFSVSFTEYSGLISFRIDWFGFIKVTDLMITASEGISFGPFGPSIVVLTALHGCSLRDQSGLRVRTWYSPAFLASPAPHLTSESWGLGRVNSLCCEVIRTGTVS